MAVPQPYIDAAIDFPVEIEGSPSISTDEVTGSRIIKRSYAVKRANWNRIAYASPDPQISNAYLASEVGSRIVGPVLFFERNYVEVPVSRVEPREIAFTLPGKSAPSISQLTAGFIGWSPYGTVAPSGVYKVAQVEFSYAAIHSMGQNAADVFTIPAITQLTFAGGVVDYSGFVFVPVGTVTIPQGTGKAPIVEPRWKLAGAVGGFLSGGDWIVSVNLSRWRGPVWQMEVVKLPALAIP